MCNDYTSCVGCLDEEADNYDPEADPGGRVLLQWLQHSWRLQLRRRANNNDGSCDFFSCIGCMNERYAFDADAVTGFAASLRPV